jgi:hypothetical protein
MKAIEDAALGMASVYRTLELPLPRTLRYADERMLRRFQDLLVRIMPLDLVIDEEAADGTPVRVSRGSVAGSWGGIAGTIRYFADRSGTPRAAIEGTQLPLDLIRAAARAGEAEVVYDPRHRHAPLVAIRRLRFFGFELDREREVLETIPPDLLPAGRAAFVEALMTGAARHKDARALRQTLERLGELHRRSGGTLQGTDGAAVRAALGARLATIRSLDDFERADLALRVEEFVPAEPRHALEALPAFVELHGERCPLDYEIEEGRAVVRVRLKEHLAQRLSSHELPALDRPLAFTVVRGKHAALRAGSLPELRRLLSAPAGRRRAASTRTRRRRP